MRLIIQKMFTQRPNKQKDLQIDQVPNIPDLIASSITPTVFVEVMLVHRLDASVHFEVLEDVLWEEVVGAFFGLGVGGQELEDQDGFFHFLLASALNANQSLDNDSDCGVSAHVGLAEEVYCHL